MSSLAVFLLCIQACLIQNTLAACYGAGPLATGIAAPWSMGTGIAGPYGIGSTCAGPFRAGIAEPFGFAGFNDFEMAGPWGARYGGAGIGNVAVAGELPVGGATALAGQVPIIGAVEYAGPVAAAGAVSIAGTCACGCGAPGYEYGYGIY